MRKLLFAAVTLLFTLPVFSQDTIALWSFPTGTQSDSMANIANFNNTGFSIRAMAGTGFIDFSKGGITTKSALSDGWDAGTGTKYWQVIVNTTHYSDILLSSCQQNGISYPGPRDWKIQYKILNSSIWTDVADNIICTNNWGTSQISNLSLPSECKAVDSLFIRWVMTSDTASSDTTVVDNLGKSKIDNILIAGTPLFANFLVSLDSTIYLCGDDSVFVAGAFQTQPGTYYDSLFYPFGNDTIIATTVVSDGPWLIEDTVVITFCENYYAGGQLQNTNGIYTDSLLTANGCDSIVVTTLEVINPFPYTDTVVFAVYDTIPVFDTINIQIFDTIITEVFDTTFITITDSISVTDTLIIDVTIDGLNPPENIAIVKVFPNPTNDLVYIDFGDYLLLNNYSFRIVNNLAQLVFEDNIVQQSYEVSVNTFGTEGIYYLQIIDPNSIVIEVRKILLQ